MLPKWNDSCMGCGKYGRWAQSGEIDIVETSNMMDNVSAVLCFSAVRRTTATAPG